MTKIEQNLEIIIEDHSLSFASSARLPIPLLVQPLRHGVFSVRLTSIKQARVIKSWCDEQGYNVAYLKRPLDFSAIRLVVSDMDSTLITTECIDEIAQLKGLKSQVAQITERSMRGELDFVASLQQRVALLEGLPVALLETVYKERVKLTEGAQTLLTACKMRSIPFTLLSGGFTYFTERLKAEYGLDYAYANQLEIQDGKLTGKILAPILDAEGKRQKLIQIRDQLGVAPEAVMAIGDGSNDLVMFSAAGVSVAFHAKPVVKAMADICINQGGLDRVMTILNA